MVQTRKSVDRTGLIFRVLAVASLVAAFAQVTLGGIVRVTGSGLGCPDWPLCHGQLIPPFEFATLIEYSHRLSASVLGVLVLGTTIVVMMRYRPNRWGKNSVLTALALVIVAAILGGATVLTELAWWLRLLHLGIAEGVVAALIIAVVVSWAGERKCDRQCCGDRKQWLEQVDYCGAGWGLPADPVRLVHCGCGVRVVVRHLAVVPGQPVS